MATTQSYKPFLFSPGFFLVLGLLLSLSHKAFTQRIIEVGGIIEQNATWTEQNIYIVTDNILLFQGVTLTIEAGTTVKFNPGRGLNVEGGKLQINGTATDSVYMVPNYTGNETWNWQGLTINSATKTGEVVIKYASIQGAVIGIKGQSSRYVEIINSKISHSFFIGINLVNSSFWNIENNLLEHNYIGTEITASGFGHQSTRNMIHQNTFSNFVTNISIQSSNLGACFNNTVENNIIKDATHGIWLFSSSQGVAVNTQIRRNLILNNGFENEGFGIFASMDSVIISENILWQNNTAVVFNTSSNSYFHQNSIYQNQNGLLFRNNTSQLRIEDNTFTGNKKDVISFQDNEAVLFRGNNIFRNFRDSAIVKNLTPFDVNITNNYWGTTHNIMLHRLFYDAHDDASLGELIYYPVLNSPNTLAPVSAPFRFYRQVVGNKTRFTWHANPESNLEGYRIFHGNFELYSFSDSTAFITDTIFESPFLESQHYAIAAYNQQPLNPGKQQFNGTKSPYAFAIQIPYAGQDTVICNTLEFFDLTDATAPSEYLELNWKTEGDGSFNDPTQQTPRYTPGSNDLTNGQVKLTLTLVTEHGDFEDELILHFAPEPTVFAGDDSYLAIGKSFFTEFADASNYSSLFWETTGEGSFDDSSDLNTFYVPSISDVESGTIKLILNVVSDYCPGKSDTITLFPNKAHTLKGRAWQGNQSLPNNPVLAVLQNEESTLLPRRYLSYSDNNGNFEFPELTEGKYILYLPSDTLDSNGFIPGYYVGQSRWQDAFVINLNGDTYDTDLIQMSPQVQLPSGTGSISGQFIKPEVFPSELQILCKPWFRSSNLTFCNEGLPNVSILLFSLSKQIIYAHTLTNEKGYFNFGNLPFGSYILEAELAGYNSAASGLIELSAESSSITGMEAILGNRNNITFHTPAKSNHLSIGSVYPNPATSLLNFRSESLNDLSPTHYSVYELSGRIIMKGTKQSVDGVLSINVQSLKPDLYIVKMETPLEKIAFYFRKN
jgi:parallel beta-helix repeat protein